MSLSGFSLIGKIVPPTITSSLSGFVAYLKYSDFINTDGTASEIIDKLDDSGGDLRFSSDEAGTNQLPCEVVEFDKVGESAQVWVRIPSLSNSTTIYIWGDNAGQSQPSATDTYGRNAVWSDYDYVTHLNETSGNAVDSTGNSLDSSVPASGVTQGLTGVTGRAYEFDGTASTGVSPSDTGVTFWNDEFTQSSLEIWAYPADDGSGPKVLFEEGGFTTGHCLAYRTSPHTWHYSVSVGGSPSEASSTTITNINTNWVHLRGVYDNGDVKLYVNGELEGTTTKSTSIGYHTSPPSVGGLNTAVAISNGVPWIGLLAGSRRSDVLKSDDHYLTEYENQSSTSAWGVTTAISGGTVEHIIDDDVAVTLTLDSDVDYQKIYSLDGEVALTLTLDSDVDYQKTYSLDGEVALTLTPKALIQHITGSELVGDVTLTLSPSSNIEYVKNYNVDSDVILTITPESTIIYETPSGSVIDGDVTLTLAPDSDIDYAKHHELAGDILLSISANGDIQQDPRHEIIGDANITLTPDSTIQYSDGNEILIIGATLKLRSDIATLSLGSKQTILGIK